MFSAVFTHFLSSSLAEFFAEFSQNFRGAHYQKNVGKFLAVRFRAKPRTMQYGVVRCVFITFFSPEKSFQNRQGRAFSLFHTFPAKVFQIVPYWAPMHVLWCVGNSESDWAKQRVPAAWCFEGAVPFSLSVSTAFTVIVRQPSDGFSETFPRSGVSPVAECAVSPLVLSLATRSLCAKCGIFFF